MSEPTSLPDGSLIAAALVGGGPALQPGEATPVRVEVWPVNHVIRTGSALRVFGGGPGPLEGSAHATASDQGGRGERRSAGARSAG